MRPTQRVAVNSEGRRQDLQRHLQGEMTPLHHHRWPRSTARQGFHPDFTHLQVPRRMRQAEHATSSRPRATSHPEAQQTGPKVAIGVRFCSDVSTSTSDVAAVADTEVTPTLLHWGTRALWRPRGCAATMTHEGCQGEVHPPPSSAQRICHPVTEPTTSEAIGPPNSRVHCAYVSVPGSIADTHTQQD
jgi:hypothetical protein